MRTDALAKVLGKTQFAGDIKLPGMLEAKILRSNVPHAVIKAIDIAQAQKMPGVHAVLTGWDIPASNSHGIIIKDEPVLATDKIRKVGEPLALVVAEGPETAKRALEQIVVRLEELPAIFDPEEAMKPGAPWVHEGGNIQSVRKIRKGDVDRAFAMADIVVENIYRTQLAEHAYIEPEAGIGYMDGDILVLMVSTQNPHFDRREVARNLCLPLHKVRVIQAPTGGGFGGKLDVSVQVYLGLAVLKTGRPVRMVFERAESMQSSTKRHPFIIDYKTAATKEGKLLAVDVRIIGDTGAYASYGPGTLTRSAVHATGPYEVPNVKVDSYAIYTNNPTAGAMRGFGVQQLAFAHEQQMDLVAEKAGITPYEVRIINALRVGSTTATGQILESSVGIGATLEIAQNNTPKILKRANNLQSGAKRRGIGYGCMWYGIGNTGSANPSSAFVDWMDDGTVHLMVGAADIGQGSNTVLAQIVAEELGVEFNDVLVIAADTLVTPDAGPTSASRQTYISGNAVLLAAREAKKVLLQEAASILGTSAEKLVLKNRQVFLAEGQGLNMALSDLIAGCRKKGKPISGHGWWNPKTSALDPDTGRGAPYGTYAFATQIVEVEVDTGTWQVDVLNIIAAHDVGRAVNPQQVEVQVEGGSVMGLGYGLYEQVIVDNGKLTTPNLATYLIPTAKDTPHIHPFVVEEPAGTGPYGAKGVGEPALIPTAAAIANAICDALGIRFTELPITPQRIIAMASTQSKARMIGGDAEVF